MTEPDSRVQSHSAAAETREEREWWCVDDEGQRVVQAKGYVCKNAPGAWWVPSLGWTLWEGRGLFPTEAAAVARLLTSLRSQQRALEKSIERVRFKHGV